MARFEGKNLVVMVENASASEVALTYVVEADVKFEANKVKFNGDDVESTQAGQLMAEVVITYEYDNTGTTGNDAVLAGIFADNTNPRFVRVRPIGTGSGKTQFSMDSVLTKYGPTGAKRGDKLVGEAHFGLHTEASADPTWAAQ